MPTERVQAEVLQRVLNDAARHMESTTQCDTNDLMFRSVFDCVGRMFDRDERAHEQAWDSLPSAGKKVIGHFASQLQNRIFQQRAAHQACDAMVESKENKLNRDLPVILRAQSIRASEYERPRLWRAVSEPVLEPDLEGAASNQTMADGANPQLAIEGGSGAADTT